MKFCESSDGLHLKPELSLLLACARAGKVQEKQAAIQQLLADGIDWTSFAQTAIAHGFASFAAHSLTRLAPESVPDDILDAFHALMDETSKANRALFEELARLVDALAKNGIEAIPFKGPLLAIQAYGDLGLREFRDLDRWHPEQPWVPAQGRIDGRPVCSDPSPAGPGNRLRGVQQDSG
jgi:hypothetical protein